LRYQVRAISVNVARAVYALNWFDITPGLIFISQDLDLKLVYLGVATTAFYIGLATLSDGRWNISNKVWIKNHLISWDTHTRFRWNS